MWRAIDREGEILDVLVQRRRDKAAALKLLRKFLKKQGFAPAVIVIDKLGSYGAARQSLGFSVSMSNACAP
jgi:putative transposase